MWTLRRTAAAVATITLTLSGALVTAPVASAATGLNSPKLVDEWYNEFLGRDADAGARYWSDQIDAGTKPSDVLWAITHSREYVVRDVTALYRQYLRRAPDAGASYWIEGATRQTFPVEWVEQNLLASQEYANKNQVQDRGEAFVAYSWYGDVLGRYNSTSGDQAYWAGRTAKIGRLGALREMWYSPEAVNIRVQGHYTDIFVRDADGNGLAYWYPKEIESDINVPVLLACSPEFYRANGIYL